MYIVCELSYHYILYIVYELIVGFANATAAELNPEIATEVGTAQLMTVINWCTYPNVCMFILLGFSTTKALIPSQMS